MVGCGVGGAGGGGGGGGGIFAGCELPAPCAIAIACCWFTGELTALPPCALAIACWGFIEPPAP